MPAHLDEPILAIPCSGIGKVQGLISREAVYRLTDELAPGRAETTCLALLVTGDPETLDAVRTRPCVAVDGCPKRCAEKNIELSGGRIAFSLRVYDVLKRYRGEQFGTPTALSDAGRRAAREIAQEILERATGKST